MCAMYTHQCVALTHEHKDLRVNSDYFKKYGAEVVIYEQEQQCGFIKLTMNGMFTM